MTLMMSLYSYLSKWRKDQLANPSMFGTEKKEKDSVNISLSSTFPSIFSTKKYENEVKYENINFKRINLKKILLKTVQFKTQVYQPGCKYIYSTGRVSFTNQRIEMLITC